MSDQLDLAADIALRLASAGDDDIDAVVTGTLEMLARRANAARVYVTLLHDDQTFENSHEWTASHVVPHRPAIQRFQTSDFPYSIGLARRDEVLKVSDVERLPSAARAERDSFSSFGVRAILQVPIRIDGQTIGLVGFNDFETRQDWDGDLIHFVRRVGQAIGVALVRRRAALAVRRASDDAERAIRIKNELLAQVSHELRTPLHAILGYAELLELDERPEHERNALLEIQLNGRRLLSMVDDLIDLAGDDQPNRSATAELGPALHAALEGLEPVADLHNVRIVGADALDDITVDVEPSRLRQVVYCALSSAVQAITRGGTITIDRPTGQEDSTPARRNTDLRLSFSMTIHSNQELESTGLVSPMARALIDGHGSIDVVDDADPGFARVVISFDQVARP